MPEIIILLFLLWFIEKKKVVVRQNLSMLMNITYFALYKCILSSTDYEESLFCFS